MTSLRDLTAEACRVSKAPEVIGERCVHSLSATASCRACVDVCPQNAWVLDDEQLGIDVEACDSCGLCVPACPEGAVVQSNHAALKVWHGQRIAFCACDKVVVDAPEGRIPCLHALGLRDLLQLYRRGCSQLLLASGDCGDCPRGAGVHLESAIQELDQALALASLPRIHARRLSADAWRQVLEQASDEPTGPYLNRRGFFRNLSGTLIQEGLERVGAVEKEPQAFLPPARLLPDSELKVFPWVPILEGSRCHGCDACVRLCPHQAIGLEEHLEDLCYRVRAENCTGCNLCRDVCEVDAIRLERWQSQQEPLLPLSQSRCTACGAPFHIPRQSAREGNGLCPICAKRNHYSGLFQVIE